MEVLRFRTDANSPWVDIPALVGAQGPVGPAGKDGTNGVDGYTPIKGVDYYTEEEKQELVNLVLAAVTDGNEVSY